MKAMKLTKQQEQRIKKDRECFANSPVLRKSAYSEQAASIEATAVKVSKYVSISKSTIDIIITVSKKLNFLEYIKN